MPQVPDLPTVVPGPIPTVVPPVPDRHAAAVRRAAQALIPDDLLDRINKFAFAGAGQAVPAPACKKQAPYTYRRRDHPVPARDGRSRPVSARCARTLGRARACSSASPGPPPGGRAACCRPSAVLAVVCAAFALRLEPSAATDTLVGRSASSFQATERYRERFGEQSVIVLVRGDGRQPRAHGEPQPPGRASRAACRATLPKGRAAPGGRASPCAALAATRPVQVVYGPGHLHQLGRGRDPDAAAGAHAGDAGAGGQGGRGGAQGWREARGRSPAEQDKAAESARQVVYAQLLRDLLQINLKYGLGLTGAPTLNDTNFVSALVFDPARGATTPKARFAYLFPSKDSAAIQVRLEPDLTEAQRRRGDRADPPGGRRCPSGSCRRRATRSPARPWCSRTSPTRSRGRCCGCWWSRWW